MRAGWWGEDGEGAVVDVSHGPSLADLFQFLSLSDDIDLLF